MSDTPKLLRVKITSPVPVSDGAGGMHAHGTSPELPEEVALILIGMKSAVRMPQNKAEEDAARRMEGNPTLGVAMQGVKDLAVKVMENHDALSAEKRAAAYDRVYPSEQLDLDSIVREADPVAVADKYILPDGSEPPKDETWPDESSTSTSSPRKSPGTTTPPTASASAEPLTSSPSSSETKPSPVVAEKKTGKATSGSKPKSH